MEEESTQSRYEAEQATALAKAEAELDAACLPAYDGEGLPPELRAVPRAELSEAYRVAKAWAAKEGKSKPLATELAQIVYLKITSTRRWNPEKGAFGRHFMLCMKSELSHHFASKAPEKEAEAREGFAREELPTAHASVEATVIRAETESEEAAAGEAKASRELELLRCRTASHELMPRVIACFERGIEAPRAIADDLGVPVEKVYRALELIRHHMKKIRETPETRLEKK